MGGELEVRVLELHAEVARVERHDGCTLEPVKIDTEGSDPELLASLPAGSPPVLWEDINGRVKRTHGLLRSS
jgi:hypothetical protein